MGVVITAVSARPDLLRYRLDHDGVPDAATITNPRILADCDLGQAGSLRARFAVVGLTSLQARERILFSPTMNVLASGWPADGAFSVDAQVDGLGRPELFLSLPVPIPMPVVYWLTIQFRHSIFR